MGTGQRFHLPSALRRGKSSARNSDWQSDGKEYKAQNILGITETILNTARNQSISSSATARLPALALSDTTTELGSSSTPTEKYEDTPDLNLKASSVLLHEEFKINGDNPGPINARRLRIYGSNSTLNSYYDAQRTPLAISQQTSDSSRRDFALRKGSPVVIKPATSEKGSSLRLFRSSKSRDGHEPKKLTKSTPPSSNTHLPMSPGSQRSLASSRYQNTNMSGAQTQNSNPARGSKTHKGVHFHQLSPTVAVNPKQSKQMKVSTSKIDTPHIKVNIRRPKAGAKHWFDGLEGDSSEEESVHEPEFHQSFVAGMEMAFEKGRIGLLPADPDSRSRLTLETSPQDTHFGNPRISTNSESHYLPEKRIPPRVSTLNAKSSRSTLSQTGTQATQPKTKINSLASTDLHKTSVLDLSSSDDEEPRIQSALSKKNSFPRLRDSIAIDALIESDIEVGTAKAIDTKQNSSIKATPSLRRVKGSQSKRKTGSLSRQHNHGSTYLSDRSSDRIQDANDLLTSFPATPTDPPTSRRTSFQGSDTASIESRRLMSVTRQEESLLAAMRLKRSALNQPAVATAGRRVQALRGDERPLRQVHQPKGSAALQVLLAQQNRKIELPRNTFADKAFDQASCTTFQTGLSNDPSTRFSVASFQTDTSLDPETDLLSPMFMTSPTFQNSCNRMSRSTFFSSSSGTSESLDPSYNRRQQAYLTTLEKLQQVPKREEILSQDFIDWPYCGWEATSKLATAH